MKIRFVLVLLLLPMLLFGMDDYASKALWIKTDAGYDLDTDPLSITRPSGDWVPYKGFQPISKTEFFSLAGMEEEAGRYSKLQTAKTALIWSSVGILAAGMTTLLCMPQTEGGRITAIATGAAAAALGISAVIVENHISFTFTIPLALETARTYDKKLRQP